MESPDSRQGLLRQRARAAAGRRRRIQQRQRHRPGKACAPQAVGELDCAATEARSPSCGKRGRRRLSSKHQEHVIRPRHGGNGRWMCAIRVLHNLSSATSRHNPGAQQDSPSRFSQKELSSVRPDAGSKRRAKTTTSNNGTSSLRPRTATPAARLKGSSLPNHPQLHLTPRTRARSSRSHLSAEEKKLLTTGNTQPAYPTIISPPKGFLTYIRSRRIRRALSP